MAEKNEKPIECVVTYSEDCGQRLTKALCEIYFARENSGLDGVTGREKKERGD